MTFHIAAPWSTASSREAGGVGTSAARASGLGWPTEGSPVVDMIDVRVVTRSGKSMANAWAIMPPIETPTMWARSRPRASSRPAASAAMSAIE